MKSPLIKTCPLGRFSLSQSTFVFTAATCSSCCANPFISSCHLVIITFRDALCCLSFQKLPPPRRLVNVEVYHTASGGSVIHSAGHFFSKHLLHFPYAHTYPILCTGPSPSGFLPWLQPFTLQN